MSTDTAKKLARVLGVSIDRLVGTWEQEEQEPDRDPAALVTVGDSIQDGSMCTQE